MNIEVEKGDIKKIGNTKYNKDGFLAIICSVETANIEEILLRSILKCFGKNYHIVDSEDFIWPNEDGEDVIDIQFITNLPYEMCEEVDRDV